MYYLRRFDPWKGKFCTCKPKYSLAPYTGCDHKCLYCYITTYIPHAFSCRPKVDFLKKLPHDLEKADNTIPISIANSSDPYPTIEKELELTRKTLKVLTDFNFKVLLVTKSDILLRDLDILSPSNSGVTFTINTNNDSLAKQLEPGAPEPSKRMAAAEKLIENSIQVMVRVDPIIPELNEAAEPLLKELASIGVECITSSTYKARPDSMKRLIKAFPELTKSLNHNYKENGEFINRAWYLPKPERERIMKNVYNTAKRLGLKFNMCREGLRLPRTTPSCDGLHLLKM
jgi:DNA repair photolyase